MHHVQGDGLDGRPGQAPRAGAEHRSAPVRVDCQAPQGVDQTQGVGAGFDGCPRHLADVGNVRRELHQQGAPLGSGARRLDSSRQLAGVRAEFQPPPLGIGAGDVQFIGRHALGVLEDAQDFDVVGEAIAEDVGEDRDTELPEEREFLGNERFHADVLKAYRVEHARRSLGHARRGVAADRFPGQALDHDRSDAVERRLAGELAAVAERTAGGDDRVLQFDAAERGAQISHESAHSIVDALTVQAGSAGAAPNAGRLIIGHQQPL